MPGIDSDNGDEFINGQLLEWRRQNQITFTGGRPCRKNDNRFAGQKNYGAVRKTAGRARFEGEKTVKALAGVCRFLNPPLNYWFPSMRLIAKGKPPSGRYKKIYGKDPKPPCRRLLGSEDISGGRKGEPRRRAAALNPIELKRQLDTACGRLLKLSVIEAPFLPAKFLDKLSAGFLLYEARFFSARFSCDAIRRLNPT
jgi:hypothetical protein